MNSHMGSLSHIIRLLFNTNGVFLDIHKGIQNKTITSQSDLVNASQEYLRLFDAVLVDLKISDLKCAYDLLFLRTIWAILELFYLRVHKTTALAKTSASDGILAIIRDFVKRLNDLDGTVLPRVALTPEAQLKIDLLLDNTEAIQQYLSANTAEPAVMIIAGLLNGIAQPQRARPGVGFSDHGAQQTNGKRSEIAQVISMLSGDLDALDFLGYLSAAQLGDDPEVRHLMKSLPYFVKSTDADRPTMIVPLTSNPLAYMCFLIIMRVRYGAIQVKKDDKFAAHIQTLCSLLLKSSKIAQMYGPYLPLFLETLHVVLTFPSIALFKQEAKCQSQEAFLNIDTRSGQGLFYTMCKMGTITRPLLLMIYAHVLDLIAVVEHAAKSAWVTAIIEYARCISDTTISVQLSGTASDAKIETSNTGLWKLAIDYYRLILISNTDFASKDCAITSIKQLVYDKLALAAGTREAADILYVVSRLDMGPDMDTMVKKATAQMFERKNLIHDAALWYKRAGKVDELKKLINRALKDAMRVAMSDMDTNHANALFAAIEAMIANMDVSEPEITSDIALAKNVKLFRDHLVASRKSYDQRCQHAKEIQSLAYELVSSPSFFLNIVPMVVSDACSEDMGTHISSSQFEELSLGLQQSLGYYNAESFLPQTHLGRRNITGVQFELCSKLADTYMMHKESLE